MKPRERLLTALAHREPDRVPIDFGGMQTTIEALAYKELLSYLGFKEDILVFTRDHVVPGERVLEMFKVDTRYIYYEMIRPWSPVAGLIFDEWGIGWRKKTQKSFYFEPDIYPLRDARSLEDIEKHRWPTSPDKERVAHWREIARKLFEETDYALVGDVVGLGVFETAWALQGLDRFMVNLCRYPSFVEALLDKVLEVKLRQYEAYLEAIGPFVQVINLSDDMGVQSGPLISPEIYRKVVKPRHRVLIKTIKSRTKAKVLLHSCGAVYEFIPDFIDVGVDVLNPIQVSAKGMEDTARLKREFGRDIVFWGAGCDSQRVLPFGTPEDVVHEVKRRIGDLKAGGGFVFAPIHNIQPGVSPENILALFEAAFQYGLY